MISSYFHGGDGPSGVGIEVEFPFVILPVVLPAIVVPLTVWLPWIVVCTSVDIAPKFIDTTRPTTKYEVNNVSVEAEPNFDIAKKWIEKFFSLD